MSQTALIADQLRHAFDGGAWHGDSVLELLAGVSTETAAAHPIKGAHSIWELVLHIAAWDGAVSRRLVTRKAVTLSDEENFPAVKTTSAAAWQQAVEYLKKAHQELIQTVSGMPDSRLGEQVPGKGYDVYFMLHGVTQHEIYHAGQIALLKKAAG